jgi:uncharacterized protein YukE
MSRMHVGTDTLQQAAKNLDTIHSSLDSLRQVPAADKDTLGGMEAYTAFQNFSDAWSYGVQQISASIEQISAGLLQASQSYQHGEATVTKAFESAGSAGTGGTKSGTKGGPQGGPNPGASSGGKPGGTAGSGSGAAGSKAIDAQVNQITDPRIKDNPQLKAFIESMALTTGLSAVVIAAWTIQEGGSATGGQYNFLNIGNTDSEFYGTKDGIWTDPTEAGKYSGLWLEGKYSLPGFGTASSGVQSIAGTADESPQDQINAIRNSGWASSGEPLLQGLYDTYAKEVG